MKRNRFCGLLWIYLFLPQHFLYFMPLPQGHGEFRDIFVEWAGSGFFWTKSICSIDGNLNENVVFPSLWVIAKSPWLIRSIPINTSQSLGLPFVTLTAGKATLFGRKILTRNVSQDFDSVALWTIAIPVGIKPHSSTTFWEITEFVAPVSQIPTYFLASLTMSGDTMPLTPGL